jgi:hypothetical protein
MVVTALIAVRRVGLANHVDSVHFSWHCGQADVVTVNMIDDLELS